MVPLPEDTKPLHNPVYTQICGAICYKLAKMSQIRSSLYGVIELL